MARVLRPKVVLLSSRPNNTEADSRQPDGRRDAKQGGVAKLEEALLHDAHRLAVGDDVAHPARHLHGGKGGDEGVDLEFGHDDAVDEAKDKAHRETGQNAEGMLSVALMPTAQATPEQATTEPTDMSNSPEARQNSMPQATMPDMETASPSPAC